MDTFKSNRKFRRDYDRLFRKDPMGANIFLLLVELANERGEIRLEAPFLKSKFNASWRRDSMIREQYQLEGLKK